mmetsp:Transcript_62167/g.161204  ORF Transcript_62167/g.161204 Transcript_62167/m.161204 type:complete len:460 (-) Transcript_62167:84-1463(-)|eukprot:CAMPEP_0115222908 /NCGR_PEP_ID=MMETSP0270-20121206/28761_1 /TAXON_ID=71861 /ORGANISM="Scrippsiella trochoidea, Strain CCMP3099" /LENGTH=459 /DNA_ID=CAMNT_0002637121 /DNA_START=84 /DNA_END=1463 /DNA_ORIENTATION=-
MTDLALMAAHAPPDVGPALHPFWVFDWEEIWHPQVAVCSAVLFLAGVLCSAAGIGGGGVYVAVLMVLGGVSTHNAVPLSKAIVFFGALASLVVNLKRLKEAPARKEKSVIDFDACRVVVPMALVGTFLGVLMNFHVEAHVIVVVLTLLLCFMTFMVCKTAWTQRCEEERALDAKRADLGSGGPLLDDNEEEEDAESLPLLPPQADYEPLPCEALHVGVRGGLNKVQHVAFSNGDMFLAGFLIIVVVLGGILRFHIHACKAEKEGSGRVGSCRHPFVVTLFAGRMEFWMDDEFMAWIMQHLVTTLPLWSCLLLAMYYGHYAHKVSQWKVQTVAAYQLCAVATGLLAGLVGVGGGLIFAPFFLIMGLDPAVAVGTSSTCVLFTSSSTTMQYLFTDRIMMSLALVYGIVTLAASYAGTSLVHVIQDKFKGRRSYITLVVATGVALSALLSLAKFVRLLRGEE